MQAYKAYATVETNGAIVLNNLPFKPGALLEVVLVEETKSDLQVVKEWRKSNKRIQNIPRISKMTPDEIREEVVKSRKAR